MKITIDRAAFERHAESLGYSVDPDTREGREGGYWSSHTHLMWQTWQAALAEPVTQAEPEPMSPERRQRWEELAAMPRQADPQKPVAYSYHPCTFILTEALKEFPNGKEILAKWDEARAKVDTIQAAISALRATPAEPVQEPVAWRTFDGEGGYDYRTYEDNEDYAAEWAKRNPRHVGWVEPLFTAPPKQPAEPVQEPGFWGRVAARQASRIKQLETAAQQALEALENDEHDMIPDEDGHMVFRTEAAITALKAAHGVKEQK